MVVATAPAKVILLGEHAVVYGRPAIAVPVWAVCARAEIHALPPGSGCTLVARDLDQVIRLDAAMASGATAAHATAAVVQATLAQLGLPANPDWRIELSSTIPMAGGMGSGAALNAALVRAIYAQASVTPDDAAVSALVYIGEQFYHGTPSGIDNTVVAYGRPVWFVKGEAPQPFVPAAPFELIIADSGTPSPTKTTVAGVRQRHAADPARYDAWFDEIGALVQAARAALERGDSAALGPLFDRNHALLAQIGVSTPQLDALVAAARAAGALGAKLSGGGGGGNVIALVTAACAEAVGAALQRAGAIRVMQTTVVA